MRFLTVAALMAILGGLPACAGSNQPDPATPAVDRRAFEEFLTSLENTLVEVNELERMGGGIRDRMILVDASSLVRGNDKMRLWEALRNNYGKIRSLRSSLETNENIREVLTKNGRKLDELVAIDAKPEGVVILYYDTP